MLAIWALYFGCFACNTRYEHSIASIGNTVVFLAQLPEHFNARYRQYLSPGSRRKCRRMVLLAHFMPMKTESRHSHRIVLGSWSVTF